MSTPPQAWWREFTREHWFVFIVATLAWFFDCMDQQFFNLARDGEWARAAANVLGSVAFCLAGVWAGHALAVYWNER